MHGVSSDRSAASAQSRYAQLLIAESVHAIEAAGPLEDEGVMRETFAHATGREQRLLLRARLLGQRLGLDDELRRWRAACVPITLGLALLAFLGAYGIAATIVGGGRTINAVTAFFALLTVPTLTLVLWLVAALSAGAAGLFGHVSFGNLLLRLLARLPGEPHPHALTMARAAHALLQRARLLPWAFGVVSHAVWAAAFVLILAALWFAFSFQQYRLAWETTILDAGFFVRFVTLTGALPHWLGFPQPDALTLLDPAAPGGNHRAWAWWLIGCAFVYGLLPRVVLGALSWVMWRRGVRRAHLDTADPYYRKLLARFDALEPSRVVDAEQRAATAHAAAMQAPDVTGEARAVVGFELPPEFAWPPEQFLQADVLERIAGAGNERRRLLDKLAHLRPRRLLVVCHAQSSPDRGTERFVREAARHAGESALLLMPAHDSAGALRWQEWLARNELAPIACFVDVLQALQWMEGSHG